MLMKNHGTNVTYTNRWHWAIFSATCSCNTSCVYISLRRVTYSSIWSILSDKLQQSLRDKLTRKLLHVIAPWLRCQCNICEICSDFWLCVFFSTPPCARADLGWRRVIVIREGEWRWETLTWRTEAREGKGEGRRGKMGFWPPKPLSWIHQLCAYIS